MTTKNLLLLCALAMTASSACAQKRKPSSSLPEWQDVAITNLNRLPMHASFFAYENEALAKAQSKEGSAYFLSLNGAWKFRWVEKPADVPQDFYADIYDVSTWESFVVPANWEFNSTGKTYGYPIYVNHPFEFGRGWQWLQRHYAQPDLVSNIPTDYNPVGCYRRTFTLPEAWSGREIFIHLGAVKSAFYIWVNGERVGYSEDSKLEAEFNLTPYLRKDNNTVALQVYRWSIGSYLEAQDFWRISGIEREVFLYATPKLHIRDLKVVASLDKDYKDGVLDLDITIRDEAFRGSKSTDLSDTVAWQFSGYIADASGAKVADLPIHTGQLAGNFR
ncbi:MAG: hypothetical protein LBS94_01240, partial [Prevotellaceae bacterium]|nr:hypothetical protein [Prevotellaceae bacterium]